MSRSKLFTQGKSCREVLMYLREKCFVTKWDDCVRCGLIWRCEAGQTKRRKDTAVILNNRLVFYAHQFGTKPITYSGLKKYLDISHLGHVHTFRTTEKCVICTQIIIHLFSEFISVQSQFPSSSHGCPAE